MIDEPEALPDPSDTFATLVWDAVQDASSGTDRSQQQAQYRLGVSNFGHCREYARRIMVQEPETDPRPKTAAFIGTVVGDAVEKQLAKGNPDWLFQYEVTFRLPSGGEVNGHPDIVIPTTAATPEFPQGVGDLKTRAELETIKKYGASQQQRFQKHAYAKACIDAGILDPDQPIWLWNVWIDRSGQADHAYSAGEWYDPDVIGHIDDWVNDVKYAVMHGEEASRDMPRDWCASWCERFTACRGNDTDVTGTIEHPEYVAAVRTYREGAALAAEAKRKKDSASIVLKTLIGGQGGGVVPGTDTEPPVRVRWTEIGASSVAYERKPHMKLDVREIRTPKKKEN